MKHIRFFLILLIMVVSETVFATDHDCEQCRGNIGPSLHGSTGKWLDQDVPHRNWVCSEIEDLEEASQQCEMCEREMIRYVHTMMHDDYGQLNVGCICAGHMQGDLAAAELKDKQLKSRAQRRQNWLNLNWKTTTNGKPCIKTRSNNFDPNNHTIVITSHAGRFSASVDNQYLNAWFNTIELAKLAAFDSIWPSRITQ